MMRTEVSNTKRGEGLYNVQMCFHLLVKFFLKNIYHSIMCSQLGLIFGRDGELSLASKRCRTRTEAVFRRIIMVPIL